MRKLVYKKCAFMNSERENGKTNRCNLPKIHTRKKEEDVIEIKI